ncbi:MAG: hypothetical protein CMF49_08400 [Legionellales bacterium]|nr:hypothetical protein [Legionellales bacterium]
MSVQQPATVKFDPNRAKHIDWDAPAARYGAVVVGEYYGDNEYARGIYVGIGGDITLESFDGNTVQFVGVLSGSILPVASARVTAATATNMVWLS